MMRNWQPMGGRLACKVRRVSRSGAGRLTASGLLLLLAFAPLAAQAQDGRGAVALREAAMDLHNAERRIAGVPPLAWDETLAADAARYARTMARSDLLIHSPRATRAMPSGENLWRGARGLYSYRVMLGTFLDEKPLLRPAGRLPDLSRTGRWQDVGHYSQMIWRGTRRLGCAVAESAAYDYLVCRYFPAGNLFGKGPLDP